MTAQNVPITFTWRALVQDHEWPEKSTVKKIPSGVQIMAVAFVLERHADADGTNVFPSVGTIADLARVSPATVRKVLKVMRDQKFLRPDGRGRHKTLKYRLVYPSLSSQIDPAESISVSKSRQTTNRTESPSAHSSPNGDIVAPSANTERSVSVPKVKDDLVDVERKKDEPAFANSNLGKMTSRGKSVVTKSQAQIDAENERITLEVDHILELFLDGGFVFDDFHLAWDHVEREVKQIYDLVYNDGNLFSCVCNTVQYFDKSEWKFRASLMSKNRMLGADLDKTRSFLVNTAQLAFGKLHDATIRYRTTHDLPTYEIIENIDVESLTVAQIRDECYRISNQLVNDVREWWTQVSDAGSVSVSVSATNTGSDEMIVEKIVETVSEKVDERW